MNDQLLKSRTLDHNLDPTHLKNKFDKSKILKYMALVGMAIAR